MVIALPSGFLERPPDSILVRFVSIPLFVLKIDILTSMIFQQMLLFKERMVNQAGRKLGERA